MTPAENIRERILAALRRQEAGAALASEYASLCRELNRRLEQIEGVLDQGDEIQALQMAEIYPPVMEEADTLSFFKSGEWGRLCERSQLTVAPELRQNAVSKLNVLYGKGISSTHPIYRELREAVLARDDVKALKIARTIESLTPGDAGAKAERERLERKVFSSLVTELGKALSSEDKTRIISLFEEAEQMTPAGAVDESSEIRAARKIRDEKDAREAEERVRTILADLDMKSGIQDWRLTIEQTSLVQHLCEKHGLVLDSVQGGTLGKAREYSEGKRADAVKKAAFDDALRSFLICLDDATSRTQARGTLTIPEVNDLLVRLNKEWQVVESFGLPVDPARVEETARIVEVLRNELDRLQKSRVTTIAAVAATILILLVASGWFVSVQYRAGEIAKGLSAGRQARSVASVKRLAEDAEKTSLPKFSPRLSSEIATSRKWMEGMEKESAACTETLAGLLKRSGDFSGEDSVRLEGQYQGIRTRIAQLPDEQQKVLQPDLLKLDKAYGDHLAALGAKDDKLVGGLLESIEEVSKPLATGGLPLPAVEKIVAARKEKESAWASAVHSPIKDLPVSADLRAKAEAEEEKTKMLSAATDKAESALKAMAASTKADSYRSALGSLREINLPCCSLIPAAKIAWNADVTAESILPDLLFPGNAPAYASLKQATSDDDQPKRLYPKNVVGSEVTAFTEILNDELTPDVKVYSLEGGEPSRKVYAKLDIKKTLDDGELSVFTGKTYDPLKDSGSKPVFTIKTYRSSGKGWEKAKKFSEGADADASRIYREIGIKDAISDSLEVHASIIQLLDRLIHSEAKDPLYQAFVIQQLLEMTKARPLAWGLQYAPGATTLMKDIDQTIRVNCGSLPQGAWMSPGYQKLVPQLRPFLEKPRMYNAEAQLNKLLTGLVVDGAAFLYAGYVDAEGNPHLSPEINIPPADLYGIGGEPEARKSLRVFRIRKEAEKSSYDAMAKPVPLTPLYYLKNGRANMVESALHTLRLESNRNEVTLPPLFDDGPPLLTAPSSEPPALGTPIGSAGGGSPAAIPQKP